MQTFREKRLLFDFPDDWQVVHYDVKADPIAGIPAGFYRRIIAGGGVAHVQAVDFICRQPFAPYYLQLIGGGLKRGDSCIMVINTYFYSCVVHG